MRTGSDVRVSVFDDAVEVGIGDVTHEQLSLRRRAAHLAVTWYRHIQRDEEDASCKFTEHRGGHGQHEVGQSWRESSRHPPTNTHLRILMISMIVSVKLLLDKKNQRTSPGHSLHPEGSFVSRTATLALTMPKVTLFT